MTMTQLVRDHLKSLERMCERFRVKKLDLFGSGAGPSFQNYSDLDFLVEFLPMSPASHAECYFGLLEGLQDLYRRKIDLVEIPNMENPFFLESANLSRITVYESSR